MASDIDSAAEEVENVKAWTEENLKKLNLIKKKELLIKGRTALPPPELNVCHT